MLPSEALFVVWSLIPPSPQQSTSLNCWVKHPAPPLPFCQAAMTSQDRRSYGKFRRGGCPTLPISNCFGLFSKISGQCCNSTLQVTCIGQWHFWSHMCSGLFIISQIKLHMHSQPGLASTVHHHTGCMQKTRLSSNYQSLMSRLASGSSISCTKPPPC